MKGSYFSRIIAKLIYQPNVIYDDSFIIANITIKNGILDIDVDILDQDRKYFNEDSIHFICEYCDAIKSLLVKAGKIDEDDAEKVLFGILPKNDSSFNFEMVDFSLDNFLFDDSYATNNDIFLKMEID